MRFRSIVIAASILGLALLGTAGISTAAPVPALPEAPVAQATPTGQTKGTVSVAVANVRSRPSTASPTIGQLKRGAQVEITNRRSGWLEIVYLSGPGKRAWISAPLVTINSAQAKSTSSSSSASSTAKSGAVPAPVPKDYQQPAFLWTWNGENSVQGKDWYFDILLFQGGQNLPYQTIPVEASQARVKNGVWSYQAAPQLQCGSQWMMAISTRENGRWAGFASPMSKGLPIGKPCDNDPCPGCGDGG